MLRVSRCVAMFRYVWPCFGKVSNKNKLRQLYLGKNMVNEKNEFFLLSGRGGGCPPPRLGPDPNQQLSFIRPPKHGSSQNNVGINMVLGVENRHPARHPAASKQKIENMSVLKKRGICFANVLPPAMKTNEHRSFDLFSLRGGGNWRNKCCGLLEAIRFSKKCVCGCMGCRSGFRFSASASR